MVQLSVVLGNQQNAWRTDATEWSFKNTHLKGWRRTPSGCACMVQDTIPFALQLNSMCIAYLVSSERMWNERQTIHNARCRLYITHRMHIEEKLIHLHHLLLLTIFCQPPLCATFVSKLSLTWTPFLSFIGFCSRSYFWSSKHFHHLPWGMPRKRKEGEAST
jgi:hypothetical protein